MFAGLVGAVATTVSPALASAQPDEASQQAREHFRRGQTLTAEGHWQAAYREFRDGYALSHRPLFLFNMAECARQGDQGPRAAELYERYLAEDPDGSMATNARARLYELQQASEGGQSTPSERAGVGAARTARPVPTPAETARQGALADPQPDLVSTSSNADDDDSSLLESWPFWAGVGAVVVAGTVTAIVLASSGGGGDAGSACTGDCVLVDFTRN
jgi:hypothetical protein